MTTNWLDAAEGALIRAAPLDDRPPQAAFIVIEVEQVELLYQRTVEKGLPIQHELKDQRWRRRRQFVRRRLE